MAPVGPESCKEPAFSCSESFDVMLSHMHLALSIILCDMKVVYWLRETNGIHRYHWLSWRAAWSHLSLDFQNYK